MNVKWPTTKKMRLWLVAVVVVTGMAAVLVNTLMHTPLLTYGDGTTVVLTVPEPFIPDFPNQTRIGKPADIPRRFLLEERDACLRKGDDVEVVAYVHSAISRVKQRMQTRLTWANATTPRMVVVFMVGRAKNDKEREIVRRESELYHDIVQGDYADYYTLLSYKALSSLYWITLNCAHVPWTLHADDDLLIDTFILQQLIENFNGSPDRDYLHCRLFNKPRVHRKGRWKVNRKELPARRYPSFCQGTIWMLPTEKVRKLLEAVPSVNFLWVDDAYVTGLLSKHIGIQISPIPSNRFGVGKYLDKDLGNKVAWYHIRGKDRTKLWPLILEHHNATATS